MIATRLALVRHAPADARPRACIGWTDAPLRDTEASARLLSRAESILRGADALICSDLRRARQTAAILARSLGLAPQIDRRLRELNFGDWEGLTWDEVQARDPERARRYFANWRSEPCPGGESYQDLEARSAAFWAEARSAARFPILVGHAGALRALAASLLALPENEGLGPPLAPARAILLRFESGSARVEGWDRALEQVK